MTDKEITDIYMRNSDTIYRVAFLYMGNKADAEDVLQNVFFKLIDSGKSFSDDSYERAWLITVTKNVCRDLIKSVWRTRVVDFEGINEPSYTDIYKAESMLLPEIMRLKSNYRVVLYLYYYEDYSIRDISEILNRKESTIQTWIAEGRKRLKKQMGGDYLEKSI